MIKLSKRTVEKFGVDECIDKAIEEMAELTQALLKLRHGPVAKEEKLLENVCEEIADVSIVMVHIRGIFPEHREWLTRKMQRLRGLVE